MKTKILGIVAAIPAVAFGAGFAIPEQTARSLGAGGTGTASATGGSTAYYNPGLQAFEDGVGVDLTGMVIAPSFKFTNQADSADTANAQPQVFVVPSAFLNLPIGHVIRIGLGAFSNYGLGVQWPAGYTGRFEGTASSINTYHLNPTVSAALGEHFGLGIGVDVVRGTVDLQRALQFPGNEGTLELGGGTWGVGYNAGLAARFADDKVRLGLNWRSYVPLHFNGQAHFAVPREFQSALVDQAVSTDITLPNAFSFGVSVAVDPKTHLSADVNYTMWSSLHTIDIAFDKNPDLNQSQYFNWHDAWSGRIGLDREFADGFTFRLGLGFDQSPAPSNTLSPTLPDADRLLASAGLGWHAGGFGIDAGYMYVSVLSRASSGDALPAYYEGSAHVAALTLSYRQ